MLKAAGAGPYDHPGLLRALEERGIGCELQAGPGYFHWTLKCSSTLQEEAFALLAHVVLRPALPGSLLESQRTLCLRERQAMGLAEWAQLRFRWEFLENRPEGLALERTLLGFGLETMTALQRRLVRPERATLFIRGDLNLAQAQQLALLNLGVWGPAPEPPLPPTLGATTRSPRLPGGLATAQGPVAATLALLPPGAPGEAAQELLAELLPRWLAAVPENLQGASGQVTRLADNRPSLLLKASGEKGEDPAKLLLSLRQWADQLGNRTITPQDCDLTNRLWASRKAVLEGPADPTAAKRPPRPTTAEDLSKVLKTWFASAQQRALLTGAQEIPPDHPALKGLSPLEWVQSKE
jgi:hypothetical protein